MYKHGRHLCWALYPTGFRAEILGMCSARAAKAFPALGEFGLETGEVEAMREAIAVGRQLRVVMFEQV